MKYCSAVLLVREYCSAVLIIQALLHRIVAFLGPLRQVDDLLAMQSCNLMCLPENYKMKLCSAVLFVKVQSVQVLFLCTVDSVGAVAGG